LATPLSALEHQPPDFIREVSPEAISFYADELSGLYLPDDFKEVHSEVFDVAYWKPEERLRGKFGRFALRYAQEEDGQAELNDILFMGTTIGLSGLGRDGNLASLRHYSFQDKVMDVLEERALADERIRIVRADYGSTAIVLGESGTPESLRVGGTSYDFGRAKAEGRQQTCELFERLLSGAIKVINENPEPRERERIISR